MKPQIINKYIYVKGKKISEADPMEITGIEEIPVVCEDTNGRTTVKDIADYVKRNSDYLTEDDLNGLVPTLTDGKIDSNVLPQSINELPQKLQNETTARVQGDADLSNRLNEATSSLSSSIASGDDSVRDSLNQRIDETNSKVASNYESVQEQIQTVNSKISQVSSDIDDKLEDFVTKSVDGEEITGRKVFKKLPQSDVAPTESSHLTNKNYVDTAIQNASENISANKVTIDTTQEITGSKSFKTLPTSSDTPSSPEDLVNKAYVDSVSKGTYVFDVTDLNDGDTVDESVVNGLVDAYTKDNVVLVKTNHSELPSEIHNTDRSIDITIDANYAAEAEDFSGISLSEIYYTVNKESRKFTVQECSINLYAGSSSNEYLSADGTYNQPTKETVGLDKVDNTADIDKPVSNPTKEYVQQQIEESAQPVTELSDRITTVSNELATERIERSEADKLLQASIDNVNEALQEEIETRSQKDTELQQDIETESTARTEEDAKLQAQINNIKDNIGKPGGSASLDESGKVPASQLPSYVDDVVEYDNLEAFPETGESGKIYVATDTNLTYRWSGTQYVEISPSLALGETASTAFPGDRGKAVEDVVDNISDKPLFYNTRFVNTTGTDKLNLRFGYIIPSTGIIDSADIQVPKVTNRVSGAMSAADKQKLDAIESTYLPLSGGTMSGSITFQKPIVGNVGDAVLYDNTANKLIIVPTSDTMNEQYPADNYTPIGVVVIPASHNVYNDGSCGVMSLKPMNCSTPATGGTSEQSIRCGVYGTDISTLRNLNRVPTGNQANGLPTGESSYAHLPSDNFSGTQCAHDTDVYYNSSPYIPSPYLTDGSRNPGYYQTTSPSSSNNALADFDGRGNTNKIITQRGNKDYSSWKPTYNTEADYPAASCCDMFYTEGTQQGDWYLPACGELGYIMPNLKKINEAITKMRNAYGSSVGVTLDTHYIYWSSSEYNRNDAHGVNMNIGLVGHYSKANSCYVRAWLRVQPNGDGIIIEGKSSNDLLNAAGGTTNINDITSNLPEATDSTAGLMSSEDKTKLESLSSTILTNGDGTKYLSDDGTYKELNVDTSTLATKDELTQSINQLGSTITSEVTELEKTDASLSSQISTINESIAGLADEYLPLTGGTLTGNLKVNAGINLGSSSIRENADSSIRFGIGSSLGGNQGYFGLMRSNTNIECIGLSESGDIRLKSNSINIVGGDNASTVRINGFDGLEFEFGKYCAVQYVEPDSYQTPSFFIQNITQSTYDGLSTKDANTLYIITE